MWRLEIVARMAQENLAAAHDSTGAAHEVGRLADELHVEVERFRV